MRKPRIGLVGLMQANFGGDKEAFYARCILDLKRISKELDFDLLVFPEGIYSVDKAAEAVSFLQEAKADFLLVQNSSFASGSYIGILAEAAPWLGLWSLPEPEAKGPVLLNSFCGINMNAAIITHYLKERPLKYKWFHGFPGDPLFLDRFRLTVSALRGIVNLRGAKIAAIGGIAPGFDNLAYDAHRLEQRFGVVIDKTPAFKDIRQRALNYTDTEIAPALAEIAVETTAMDSHARAALDKHVRVCKAYTDLVKEGRVDAVASICWPNFRTEMEMVPCAAFGWLNDHLVPVACEGDVLSAVSMLLMKMATGTPSILMDLVEFDQRDHSVLLWHCGVGSTHYARCGVQLQRHFNPGPYSPEKGWPVMAPVAAMEFRHAPATILGFMEDGARMLAFSGTFMDKPGRDGSSGWLGDLKFNGQSGNVLDLVNTILVMGYHHHYPLVWGENSDLFSEISYWLDIHRIETLKYEDCNRM
ncbi:MAG TPA: hypothetical protein DD727_06955 [Clostridiales bacterium]|nr:hypothetical protein [Clostridiales bacterium]